MAVVENDMDITKEIDKIIEKYNLDEFYPEYKNLALAKKLLRNYGADNKERILCVSTSRYDIIRFKKDTDFMLDADYVEVATPESARHNYDEYVDFTALEKKEISNYKKVLIISFYAEGFIKRYLRRKNIIYESIYDYFSKNGLYMEREYYLFFQDKSYGTLLENPVRQLSSACSDLMYERFYIKREYETTKDYKLKEVLLKKAFFLAILDRDCSGAEEIVGLITAENISAEKQLDAARELRILIDKIKLTLRQRQSDTIIALWIDYTSYSNLSMKDYEYISSLRNDGIWFTNIHTVTPYTNQTMKTIMLEKTTVDDNTNAIEHIDESNSPLIKMLKKNGYKFLSIDGCFDAIDKKYRLKDYREVYASFSSGLWELYRTLCLRDEKIFVLVHELMETHAPFISYSLSDDEIGKSQNRKLRGIKEVTKQLKEFDEIVPSRCTKMVFSDHGDSNFVNRFHTFMSIRGGGVPTKRIDSLVSLLSFCSILEMLIDTKDVDEKKIEKTEIPIQDGPYYNGKAIGNLIDSGQLTCDVVGYKGLATNDYYYLLFSNGVQWLCSRGNEGIKLNPNLLFDMVADERTAERFKERLKKGTTLNLGEKSGKYSKFLGLALNDRKSLNRNNKKITLIKELISNLPEGGVAIRTGGIHSYTILSIIMQMKMIKKIDYIIDINKQCMCMDFGIPIITPAEAKCLPINRIIAAYFDMNYTLKEEYEGYKKRGVKIVDCYELLSKNGINIKNGYNFYDFELECDTYSLGFPREEVGM